jgi:heptosyltransferase III
LTVRVVLFRPGALGDTILTTDAIAALRHALPGATIELVGNAAAAELLRRANLVDTVRSFDDPLVTGIFLRPPRLPPEWRSADVVVAWVRGAEPFERAFNATGQRLVVADPESDEPTRHVADHLLATLVPIGVQPILPAAPVLLTSARDVAERSSLESLVLVHPGSGSPRKNWPADRFHALIELLAASGCAIRLVVGPADQEAANAVGPGLPRLPSGDLVELARALSSASLFVGNDSGVTHLSARLAVPTVAIFGPTDPRRWAPRGPSVRVVGHPEWPGIEKVWTAAGELLG